MLEQSLIRECHCSNGGAIDTNLVVASNKTRWCIEAMVHMYDRNIVKYLKDNIYYSRCKL